MPRKPRRRVIPESPAHRWERESAYPLFQGGVHERHVVIVNQRTIEVLRAMGATNKIPRQIGPGQFEIEIDGQVKAVLAELDPDIDTAIQKAPTHQYGTS